MNRRVVLGSFVTLLSLQLYATDWPQWRGPHRTGISDETNWTSNWAKDGPPRLWKAALGTGFSSVAVSGGLLYTLGNSNATDTVFCFDAESGALRWKYSYPSPLEPNLYEGGPNATPTIDADRIYTLSKNGLLICFQADSGKVLWQTNLVTGFGIKKPEWGFSSSPVVEGNLLLLNAGGAGTAVQKSTGRLAWSAPGVAAYPTPLPFELEGTRAAIFLTRDDLVTVALNDGKLLWKMRWKTRYEMGVPDAVYYQGKLFVSSWGEPGALIEFKDGQGTPLWRTKDMWQHVSSPVAVGDFLYGFHGDAPQGKELKCLDLRTGKVKWTEAGLPNGALMAADGKLIILTGRGELIVAQASPIRFQPLARAQVLDGKCWTVPVLANGRLYCRNAQGTLVCLDVHK